MSNPRSESVISQPLTVANLRGLVLTPYKDGLFPFAVELDPFWMNILTISVTQSLMLPLTMLTRAVSCAPTSLYIILFTFDSIKLEFELF